MNCVTNMAVVGSICQRVNYNYNYNRDLLCAPYKQNDGALHCHEVLTIKAVLNKKVLRRLLKVSLGRVCGSRAPQDQTGQFHATFTVQESRQTPLGRGVTIESTGQELGANSGYCILL